MNKIERLQKEARNLRALLEHYAEFDEEAEAVLERMSQIFCDIESGKVTPPHDDKYLWYFANTEGPLYKYDDLGEAHARYSHAIRGWVVVKRIENGVEYFDIKTDSDET